MDMSTPTGATGLLAGAISYALAACALIRPGEMTLSTPCPDWDLAALLGHLGDSMADLETAIRTGRLDLDHPRDMAGEDPVEAVREQAAQLLCAAYCYVGPESFVMIGGLPLPAGLVACTGAVEIAVHGWDVTAALARAGRAGAGRARAGGNSGEPIPAALATRMLRLCPLIVAGRENLFAVPVAVPAQASPGDQLVGYLGRRP
jgi:uncharacterized protein (TIGR03086 family)